MFEYRFSLVLIIVTFCLLLWGGIVHGTGSSLACPDWPTCYGTLMPDMKGNIAIEHGHRLLATTVGIMTLILAGLIYKRHYKNKLLVKLGVLSIFLVVFQGILGGITVLYKLPDLVSTAHLGTSMLFFSTLIIISWKLHPDQSYRNIHLSLKPIQRTFTRLTLLMIYFQIIIGALVRHTGSGIACPDIPFCYGQVWPLEPMLRLHMSHRWNGVLVAIFVFVLFFTLLKTKNQKIIFFSGLLLGLVLLQITLGLLSVVTSIGLIPTTAHLGTAALMMGTIVSLATLTGAYRNTSEPLKA